MKATAVWDALRRGEVVELPPDTLLADMGDVEEISRFDGMYGEMVLFRFGSEWIVREASDRRVHLLRLFPDREGARTFIDARIAQIERMWDGCGIEIDYCSHKAK